VPPEKRNDPMRVSATKDKGRFLETQRPLMAFGRL